MKRMPVQGWKICALLLLTTISSSGAAHVYLVFHATMNGKTGHTGIAIDNYQVILHEEQHNGRDIFRKDTVRSGKLTYYDFWTKNDQTDKKLIFRDQPPRYYKLPLAAWEPDITLEYLLGKGMPYHYGYTVEGLIRMVTTPDQDEKIKNRLDSLIALNRSFHAITWNCSDFAEYAIELAAGEEINAKEFIWGGFSTTPNKLFRKASCLKGAEILRDPGKVVYGTFLVERIWKRVHQRWARSPR